MSTRIMMSFLFVFVPVVVGCESDVSHDWPDQGINLNEMRLTKSKLAACCFRGGVRSIQLGDFDGDAKPELVVVPQTGVYFFDAITLQRKASYRYQTPEGEPIWFGLSPYLVRKQNGFAIAMRGGGYGRVGVLDQDGTLLWEFKPHLRSVPNGMVIDDSVLGEPVFYSTSSGTIYKLDFAGEIVWSVNEKASHMALIPNQSGDGFVVATANSYSNTLNVWSSEGSLVQQINLPFNPDRLVYVSRKDVSGFVIKSERQIAYVGRDGKTRFTHYYEDVPIYHGPTSKLVHFRGQSSPVLVVRLQSRSAVGRSVISMFSLDGKHLYEEYLDGGPALGVIPVVNEERERLIVGEGPKALWVYESN